jgi:hypothetical protein
MVKGVRMPDGVAKDVLQALVRMAPLPGSLWVHRKGGVYTVVTGAVREADLTPLVVYRDAGGVAWVRTLAEFKDRFRPAGEDESC